MAESGITGKSDSSLQAGSLISIYKIPLSPPFSKGDFPFSPLKKGGRLLSSEKSAYDFKKAS